MSPSGGRRPRRRRGPWSYLPHALVAAGLVLLGVVVALLVTRQPRQVSAPPTATAPPPPSAATTAPPPTTAPPSTTAPPPPATTAPPATTTAPPPPPPPPTTAPPPPSGPAIASAQVTAVTPFSATITWTTTFRARGRAAYGPVDVGQVIWSPLSPPGLEHESTLSGLSYSTTYDVRLTAWAAGGRRAESTLRLTTPGPPASVEASTAGGAIEVDGQPFFPLMVWGVCPDTFGNDLNVGINLFAVDLCGGVSEQLAQFSGRALFAAKVDEQGAATDGVVGWFYPDEADAHQITAANLPPAPPGPPGRLTFLTLSNHFYSGADRLPQGRAMYPGLIARADVVGFDLYPLQNWCRPAAIGEVYDAQRELVGLAQGKPTFQWIEAGQMSCSQPGTQVTPQTIRAESWLAVAAGARGLGFFPAQWTTELGQAVAGVAAQARALAPALLAPDAPVAVTGPVRVAARRYDGALYVVAVNPGTAPVQARVRVPGLAGRALAVLGEGRSVSAKGDAFADSFGPLAVHLYVAAPRAS